MGEILKAPFPWFGGKSKIAGLVWSRLGDVDNYIEPFAGSVAALLRRPHAPRIETINDLDCYVANFWRATKCDPEAVAEHADNPINEADLHARHRWLVLSDGAAAFREMMRCDPDYYDARIAGWWVWGLCCWIGSGWCDAGQLERNKGTRPFLGEGQKVNAKGGEHSPKISEQNGIHAKRPVIAQDGGTRGKGVNAGPSDANRPQLADAFSRGRGVHGNDQMETCEQRRAWLLDWFGRLRDRLRPVRVCCGDWSRVCSSPSTTTRLGLTGVFLDPPYGALAGRDASIYATDSLTVAAEVCEWCKEYGHHRRMRIALCGYAGEGHEELETLGWDCVHWKAQGGYGNRSEKGKDNAAKERIWFSPHCVAEHSLFSGLR
jgi:site-specific DNA-adenine methylase